MPPPLPSFSVASLGTSLKDTRPPLAAPLQPGADIIHRCPFGPRPRPRGVPGVSSSPPSAHPSLPCPLEAPLEDVKPPVAAFRRSETGFSRQHPQGAQPRPRGAPGVSPSPPSAHPSLP